MKVTELMIGDWVYSLIDRDGKTVKEPQRIKGIWADDYNGKEVLCSLLTNTSDVWYSTETFEPIPITPEILEKNGFIKDAFTNLSPDYYLGNDEYSICINLNSTCDKSKSVWIEKRSSRFTVSIEESRHSLDKKSLYVHQLQQAMRLCGIGKEIIVEDNK